MSEIKSLADQLRSRIAGNNTESSGKSPPKKPGPKNEPGETPILGLLRAYDLTGHKSMVHVRFEDPTTQMLHHLKLATGIEVNKVVGFAVKQFIEAHPELKTIVKQYLQTIQL